MMELATVLDRKTNTTYTSNLYPIGEKSWVDFDKLIPKLKIISLNPVFWIINRVSDHKKQYYKFTDLSIKLVLGWAR